MKARIHIFIARGLLALAVLFLLLSWGMRSGGTLMGMDQGHLFHDAGMFALLSIAVFADAYFHLRRQ